MEDATVDIDDLSVAIAHWHVRSWGGAEYLVTRLAEALGRDRVYTLGEPTPDTTNPYGDISFEDITPRLDYSGVRRVQRLAGRVFEYAQWEDVDWSEFGNPDILLTSGATTRAVITPDDTLHVNYCHSPPRWFYDLYHDRKNSFLGVLSRPLLRYLRLRDITIDPRVDSYFVNSPIVGRRLWKYYKRDSEVLFPPVELAEYQDGGDHDYFLHLGRLDGEKGVPAVIEAFNHIDNRLVLAGGRGDVDKGVIATIEASENIEWRGFVSEEDKLELLARCTAVVFNGRDEDFGIVPVEANASGKLVLARNEGFPATYVDDRENGILHDGTAIGIRDAVREFDNTDLDGKTPAERAAPFQLRSFQNQLVGSLLSLRQDLDLIDSQ